ncbi:hypothetical protein Y1Q_0001085 [Alligator mississippiensis]|uniref:Uncharacterized protein n=1 Tax=Alligator mississippiensis TaxID=8496 RepID=A0A151NEJ3_ALLMI|nr:hypothetical protein Y1Q_0001085 [Alligator mississippiensis]
MLKVSSTEDHKPVDTRQVGCRTIGFKILMDPESYNITAHGWLSLGSADFTRSSNQWPSDRCHGVFFSSGFRSL